MHAVRAHGLIAADVLLADTPWAKPRADVDQLNAAGKSVEREVARGLGEEPPREVA